MNTNKVVGELSGNVIYKVNKDVFHWKGIHIRQRSNTLFEYLDPKTKKLRFVKGFRDIELVVKRIERNNDSTRTR